MDAAHTSYDPLAQFERSTAVDEHRQHVKGRGMAWVVRWFAALATLGIALSIMAQFGYCLAAERTLARAARAGLLEASLPRSTPHSVGQTVERRLAGAAPELAGRLRFSVQQNGAPIRGIIRTREGDRLRIALAVATREVLPRWLRAVCFWSADGWIEVQAERQVPGRQLPQLRQR